MTEALFRRNNGLMKRSDALAKLKAHADAVRAMGAVSLYLYGSTARDEAEPASRFNAFDLVGIKQFLEDQPNP